DRDVAHLLTNRLDEAGELAAGDERGGCGDLVGVGDDQRVREVDRGDRHADTDITGADRRRRAVLHRDDLGRAVLRTDRGPHHNARNKPPSTSTWAPFT